MGVVRRLRTPSVSEPHTHPYTHTQAFVHRAADAALLAAAATADTGTTAKLAKPAYDLLNACLSGACVVVGDGDTCMLVPPKDTLTDSTSFLPSHPPTHPIPTTLYNTL